MTMTNNEYTMFILVWILIGVLASERSVTNANRLYNHPGETHPVTVEAAIGTNFNITCYMNPKIFPGKNSTCLHFVIGRTNEELPRQNIISVNGTTIVYMVRNASEQQTEYRCKCGLDAIMETKVFVGSRPRPGRNFSCRGYDFDHMICNFTKPSNPILTTYNVSYYNDFPSYIYLPQCNYDDRSLVVCNTSLKDRYQEMYHFIIESSNALVKPNEQPLIQRFDINNFEIMIPSKPGDNMRVESLTANSIKISWQMVNWEKYRAKGLQWEVLLHPENSTVMQCDSPLREHSEIRLRLDNLPYAYWRYKLMIRVRVKSPNAIWSDQFVYTFRTAACRPQRPPRVQPGGFYIDSSETRITIYWEELKPTEYNGNNFTYVISSVDSDGKLLDLIPKQQEKNLAKFSWRKDTHYEFEIRSRNHIGESIDASRLIIYQSNQRNPKDFTPQAIHNVYHGNNRTYTLTWSKPRNITDLLSFTIFWCFPKRALPNECKESIYFEQIPADQLNFTTKAQTALEEHALNLAVSANYYKFNTGLHWTDCTMDVNSDLVKMDPDLVVSVNSIKVQWSVERVCPSILDGFNITYCEIDNTETVENATCRNSNGITKLAKKNDKKYYIEGLKPYTLYKLSMFMFSRTKKGKPSEPQIVRTLEGAPSPPRQLCVENITNTSATIKWFEPSHTNGKIRKYIIMLNNDQIEVNASTLTYHLENLESFTAYKVYVLAETVKRSETSNDVHFTTAIGIPSPPGIAPNNNVASIIQWSKPVKPRGSIEFYEVLVTQLHNEEIVRRRISIIIGSTTCNFTKVPICIGPEYKTTVEVRAINVVPINQNSDTKHVSHLNDGIYNDNEDLECITNVSHSQDYLEKLQKYMNVSMYHLYKSSWQTSAIYSCSTSRMSKITTIALVVVAMSLSVMAALYMARKKYNKMANINCTLPAGLETYFTKDSGTGFPNDFRNDSHNVKAARVAEGEWISAAGIHGYNFRNEHHHLLASLGNDSGYLGVGGVECGVNNSEDGISEHMLGCTMEITNVSEGNVPHNQKEHLQDCMTSVSSSADSLVESTEGLKCHNIDVSRSPLTILPNNNGYVKQTMLHPWQNFNDHHDDITEFAAIPAISSGYVSVQNLNSNIAKPSTKAEFRETSAGYVLQQDLERFLNRTHASATPSITNSVQKVGNIPQFNNDSYTTIDNLTKLDLTTTFTAQNENHYPLNEISNINSPQIVAGLVPSGISSVVDTDGILKTSGISGYVTQHDLNLFAQHKQNH